ncbi:MAG: rhodanese-like domain-containing protein [Leptolyngbyaceae bacterium]|nr:rhodanese-like domain-containing protein [Leptolyngbyaceae bacterium]
MASPYRQLRSLLLSSVLMLSGVAHGCSASDLSWQTLKQQIRAEFPSVEHISVQEFETYLPAIESQDSDSAKVLLVDVRAPEEFAVSHLHHAVNLEDANAILDLAQQRQVEQIILYCSVGYRSAKMAQTLEQQGWDAVVNLEGSLFEWANSGRPVFRGDEEVEVVHPFDQFWGQLLKSNYHPHTSE